MAILLANIGNRDVELRNGEEINKGSARVKGEKIWENYDKYKNRIQLPILEPLFDYIGKEGENLRRIHLFVTDQSSEKYRDSDTLVFGKIIKKYIKELKGFKGGTPRVILHSIEIDPSLYDYMFKYFDTELNKLKKKIDESDRIYVTPTGGTPACSMNLVFHSVSCFGDKVVCLYVRRQGRIEKLDISKQLSQNFQKHQIMSLLGNYSYSDIKNMEIIKRDEDIQRLVRCAEARVSFNFEDAKGDLRSFIVSRGCVELEPIRDHLETLAQGDFSSLIKELLINTEIKFEVGQYVDMLGRLFRLEESLLAWVIRKQFGIDITDNKGRFSNFRELIKNTEGLEDYLKSQRVNGEGLEYDKPNRENMRSIVSFIASKKGKLPCSDLASKVLEISKELQKASELRNKTIIAHGFQGVSKKELEDKGVDVKGIIDSIKELLSDDLDQISFRKINEVVERYLQEF